MSIFILTALRYLFLIFFYVFIFFVVKQIVLDIKHNKPHPKSQDNLNCFQLRVIAETEERLGLGKCFTIKSVFTIGRASSNNIQIHKDFISKKHAQITLKAHQYWIKDLNSLNGTYINNKLVKKPVALTEGDEITIGGVTFKFERCAYEVE